MKTKTQVKIEIAFLALFLLATSIIGFTANGIDKEYKTIITTNYRATTTKFDQIKGIAPSDKEHIMNWIREYDCWSFQNSHCTSNRRRGLWCMGVDKGFS